MRYNVHVADPSSGAESIRLIEAKNAGEAQRIASSQGWLVGKVEPYQANVGPIDYKRLTWSIAIGVGIGVFAAQLLMAVVMRLYYEIAANRAARQADEAIQQMEESFRGLGF